MAKDEKSGPVASIASRVLAGAKPTTKEVKTLAAPVLTQTADRKKA